MCLLGQDQNIAGGMIERVSSRPFWSYSVSATS